MKTIVITENIPAGTKKIEYDVEDYVYDKVIAVIEGINEIEAAPDCPAE